MDLTAVLTPIANTGLEIYKQREQNKAERRALRAAERERAQARREALDRERREREDRRRMQMQQLAMQVFQSVNSPNVMSASYVPQGPMALTASAMPALTPQMNNLLRMLQSQGYQLTPTGTGLATMS
jgi:hypothetical protein